MSRKIILNNKTLNKSKMSLPIYRVSSILELVLIFLVVLIFGYFVLSLISQIYSLNLELKNLVALVQSLQENQENLKSQLLVKDQEIQLLENTINNINTDAQNFELLKKEIIKNNTKMTLSFFKVSGVLLGVFCAFKLIKIFL